MAGYRSAPQQRLTADAEKLVADALALSASGSRVEDQFWESRLTTRLARLIRNGSQTSVDGALDHLAPLNPDAYAVLVELAETCAESMQLEHEGATHDVLLIAAPILAHTRYAIPSGPLKADATQALAAQLFGHVLANGSRMALAPYMYSIDQLPRSHAETHALLQRLGLAALSGNAVKLDLRDLPETAPVLADPRYLLAAIAVPPGQAMFRWQEDDRVADGRALTLRQWQDQATPSVARLLPGVEFELLTPDAFFVSCREADKRVRPLTIKAALNYLQGSLNVEPNGVAAVLAPFGESETEEYRIGFHLRGARDIIYGIVWPLYDREPALAEQSNWQPGDDGEPALPLDQIREQLRACGVEEIFAHDERFALEACDDCGAPLYADRAGELVHAEMPEDAPTQQPLFH